MKFWTLEAKKPITKKQDLFVNVAETEIPRQHRGTFMTTENPKLKMMSKTKIIHTWEESVPLSTVQEFAQGRRQYVRKQQGFGSQSKPFLGQKC